MVWNITCHKRGTPFILEKYIVGLPGDWQCWHLWCLAFILSFFFSILCFCFPIASSPLSCFIEIEVLITAQANLELTECLRHGIPRKPSQFPMKCRRPFLFLFPQCLYNHLLSFYDSEENQVLKNFYIYNWFLCFIHYYFEYEWNSQLMVNSACDACRIQLNSHLHTGSQLSCSNYWVLGYVSYQGRFPKIAHFIDSGNSPSRSKVLLIIFQIHVLLRSCLDLMVWPSSVDKSQRVSRGIGLHTL